MRRNPLQRASSASNGRCEARGGLWKKVFERVGINRQSAFLYFERWKNAEQRNQPYALRTTCDDHP